LDKKYHSTPKLNKTNKKANKKHIIFLKRFRTKEKYEIKQSNTSIKDYR